MMPKMPKKFLPIGSVVKRRGTTLKVVERPPASALQPCEACMNCYYRALPAGCESLALQCSKFDRRDKKSVWFVEAKYL